MNNNTEYYHISNDLKPLNYSRKGSIFYQWKMLINNIRLYSFYIFQLTRIDILKDFKRSYIGILWLFILPILSVVVWVLLNSIGVIEPGETDIPYPAYVLLSTSIWGFFVNTYRNISQIYISGGNMFLVTDFPKEVLIVKSIIVHLIRFTIPFIVNVVVLLLFGIRFTWIALLFPLTLLPLLILGLSIGLIVSILKIVAVDIARIINQGINFLMFLTPVVYVPNTEMGFLSKVIFLNPLTYLIGFSREVLTHGIFYKPLHWSICTLGTFIVLIIAVRIFILAEDIVMERLIN